MIGSTISHYPAVRDPRLPTAGLVGGGQAAPLDKILEKSHPDQRSGQGCSFHSMSGAALGEVRKLPASVFQRAVAMFRIPPHFGGS